MLLYSRLIQRSHFVDFSSCCFFSVAKFLVFRDWHMKHSQAVSRLECVAKVRKIDWSATENYKRAQEVKRLECAEKDRKLDW